MHRCLSILDVVSMIATCLGEGFRGQPKKDLLAMAMTCRSFVAPALDALWQNQSSLKPLLSTLPESLVGIRFESHKMVFYSRRYATVPDDWTRFQLYAPRIKKFQFYGEVIDPGLFFILKAYRPSNLLRNLSAIYWSPICPIDIFLGPSLSTICFTGTQSTPETFSVSVPTLAPQLRSLECYVMMSPNEGPALTNLISNLYRLEQVTIMSFVSASAIAHLASLSSIREASFNFSGEEVDPDVICSLLPNPSFSALRKLRVHVDELSLLARILPHMHGAPLRSLHITATETPTAANMRDLLVAVATTFSATLQSLRIDDEEEDYPGNLEGRIITDDILSPALGLSNLTEFIINMGMSLDISLPFVQELAKSWTKLKRLDLSKLYPLGDAPNLSIEAFVPLAKFCPNLVDIAIHVDARHDRVPHHGPGGVSNHSVKSICADSCAIDQAPPVAAFLASLFPSLETVFSHDGGFDDDDDDDDDDPNSPDATWGEVRRLFPVFDAVRDQGEEEGR
ncbi:hypothetical protein JAAARDRAFT_63183 [Jaapia argillacea MUCL 33604]|uniref:F-box domain-containing protein n=1 Tax=Jaapia argillacea MUCL 33604 TaxID=933084 RepID=A0A067P9B9_9AGAM|nr:hypothetical protein JAAARDRAFT_63183 [Jaapia argillacea MUCL 33604]